VPVFPAFGIVLSLTLVVFGLSRDTLIWFAGSLTVGLIIYFAYGFANRGPTGCHRDGG